MLQVVFKLQLEVIEYWGWKRDCDSNPSFLGLQDEGWQMSEIGR
jgi:hypothetical protein